MKRKITFALSCLLVFCIIAASLPIMAFAAEQTTNSDPAYYMTGSEIIKYITKEDGFWGLATETSYNSAEDSVTVSYTAKPDNVQGKPGRAGITNISALNIDAAEYPVVAIKVKLTNNTALQFGRLRWATDALASGFISSNVADTINPAYRVTDNYQLMVFDLTKYNNEALKDNYRAFFFDFAREDVEIAPTSIEWQSIAFFKTAADAEKWYAENDGVVGNDVEGRIVTLDDGNSSLITANNANTTVEYDETVKALKVSGNAPQVAFNFDSNGGAYEFDIAKYPIIALHVKTDGIIPNGFYSAATVDWRAAGSFWKHFDTARFQYANTTDWQWIFYDVGSKNIANLTGNWLAVLIQLTYNSDVTMYIDELAFVSSNNEIDDIFYKSIDKLGSTIASAESIDKSIYTAETVSAFDAALANAKSVTANYATTVNSVNASAKAAETALLNAIDNLEIATVSDPAYYMTGSEINKYSIKEDGYWGLATETSYNSAEDSVTVSYTAKFDTTNNVDYTNGKPGRAGINNIASLGINSQSYPIVAIKVKIANTALQLGRFRWSTEAVKSAKEEGTYGSNWVNYSQSASADPVYRATDNYQLLVFDLTKYNSEYLSGNYTGFLFDFAREDVEIAPTSIEWQSIAFFKTAADAEKWYAENDGVVGNDVEGRIVTLDDGNSSLITANNANTTVEYDETVKALKVSGNAPQVAFNFDSNGGAYEFDIAKYPIIALHVKTDGIIPNGFYSAATVDWRAAGSFWKHFDTARFQYANTTDWQWIFYDVGSKNIANLTGNWLAVLIQLTYNSDVTMYIDELAFVSSNNEIDDIFYKSVEKLADDIADAQSVDTTGRRSDTVEVLNNAIANAKNVTVNKSISVAALNETVATAKNDMTAAIVGLKDILKGDINGDEIIDIRDLVRVKKYIANVDGINVIADNSDFNNDDSTDTYELTQLRKYLLGVDDAI